MIDDSSERDDETESVAEPMQRIETTFRLAPEWQHLAHAPIGEFETCDMAPLITIRVKPIPPAEEQ